MCPTMEYLYNSYVNKDIKVQLIKYLAAHGLGSCWTWLDLFMAESLLGHGWIMQGMAVFGQLPMAYQAGILGGTWLFCASHAVPV